jgi:hypothetical protein
MNSKAVSFFTKGRETVLIDKMIGTNSAIH